MCQQAPKYLFYPSLLDKFHTYLHAEVEAEKPWHSGKTPAEVEDQLETELLNSINRVPFESEPAEKGTAFNNLVDAMIAGHVFPESGNVIPVSHVSRSGKEYYFEFPASIVWEFVEYFKGSVSQIYCEGILPTKYGDVQLYGFIDELREDTVYDIKTTSRYEYGKYKNGCQRHVYPYCLYQKGILVRGFEFSVTDFRNTHPEWYDFNLEASELYLRGLCELFIEYIEARRHLITDLKIFNLHKNGNS